MDHCVNDEKQSIALMCILYLAIQKQIVWLNIPAKQQKLTKMLNHGNNKIILSLSIKIILCCELFVL